MKRGGAGITDVFNNAVDSFKNVMYPGQNNEPANNEAPKDEEKEGSFIGSVYKSFTSEKIDGLQATVAEGEKQIKKLKKKKDELNAKLDADIKKCNDAQEILKKEIDKANSDSEKISNMIAAGSQSRESSSETQSETPEPAPDAAPVPEAPVPEAPEAAAQAEEYKKAMEANAVVDNNPVADNNAADNVSSDSTLTAGEIKQQLPGLIGGTRRKKRKTKRRRHRGCSRKKRKSRARGSSRRKRGF